MAETKALISFAVTAKLICVFVFAYAKAGFLTTRLIYIGSVEKLGLRPQFSTLSYGPDMVNEWKNITNPSRIYM